MTLQWAKYCLISRSDGTFEPSSYMLGPREPIIAVVALHRHVGCIRQGSFRTDNHSG